MRGLLGIIIVFFGQNFSGNSFSIPCIEKYYMSVDAEEKMLVEKTNFF